MGESSKGNRTEPGALFDTEFFGLSIRQNALPPFGAGKCAEYVRRALEVSGMATGGRPASAKDYGPYLVSRGFRVVAEFSLKNKDMKGIEGAQYSPACGDIAVIQSTSRNKHGHIQGFDGQNWVSDFVQEQFWPGPAYRSEKPSYVVYRQ